MGSRQLKILNRETSYYKLRSRFTKEMQMLAAAAFFYALVNYLTCCQSAYILKFVNYPVMHILV